MPVLIRGALALLLRDIEVGKADERGENVEKDARAQPPLAAAEGGADDAGEHAEADHVVERVNLDAEVLLLLGAVLFRAGDAPVEGIEQPREHQAQHGVERLVLRGGIEAAKPQQQTQVQRGNGEGFSRSR